MPTNSTMRQTKRDGRLSAGYVKKPKKAPEPESPFPVDHEYWEVFVRWVKHGCVVRTDLLDNPYSDHWKIIWETFLGGADCTR